MITISAIKPQDFLFLQKEPTLYSGDFRAVGESLLYDIPTMWKYENLLPWILDNQVVAVNDGYKKLQYPATNQYLVAPRPQGAKQSLLNRLEWPTTPSVESLWVAVPHPDTDSLAQEHSLSLNYTYVDFLQRNDKIRQKELLADSSPPWELLKTPADIEKIASEKTSGFIKRRHGSGGYTVFPVNQLEMSDEFRDLTQKSEWFFEDEAKGTPFSIQCVHHPQDDTTIIFGYSKQHIANGKYFIGSSLLPVTELTETALHQLETGIKRLQPLLKGYEGFFGLDFIVDENDEVQILEANIRLTAATVPTLLMNMSGHTNAEFREDVPKDKADTATLILTRDDSEKTLDTLTFLPSHQQLGVSFFLDLQECDGIPKQITDDYIFDLAQQVTGSLGKIIGQTSCNFWPHGWTACFVLEASHCVISTWFLEKRVLIDAFSCAPNIEGEQVHDKFVEFFNSNKPGLVSKQVRK